MVRTRATRFTPKPVDSVSIATQVKIPTPTTTQTFKSGGVTATVTRATPQPTPPQRTTRTTRFTPTPTPTPTPRPTPTNVFSPTPTPEPRQVSTPTPTITGSIERERTTRTTRFTPRPTPPRDDFQRSLNPLPFAFAEEQPRQQQQTLLPVTRTVAPTRITRGGRGGSSGFVPVRTTPKETEFRLTDQQRAELKAQPRQSIEQQRANNQALLDQGLPTVLQAQNKQGLSDFDKAFASFGGGVNQEVLNLGSIAGVSTFKEEAGSLAIDLPFQVVGETFTRPSVEKTGGLIGGGGFGGLGFDFRESPDFDAGFEKSGEIQKKIGDKFAEDPARALGSVFAVATIETAIFVGTGGAGKIALKGAQKFAQIKGRSIAEKVGEKFAEKGVPRVVENIGTNEFLIAQGVTAGAKRGIVIGKLDAVAIGLKKALNPVTATFKQVADNLILTKTPTLRGVTTGGKKGKIPSKRALGIETTAKEADIPLIHVKTNVNVNGKKETVVTLFTKETIRETGFPTDATIRGITNAKTLERLGLEQVGEKATFVQGKLQGGAVRELRLAEESGQIRLVGKGIQFLADDIFKNPKTLKQIAITGKTIGGQSARLSTTEIFEAQALGGAKFVKESGKGIGNVGVSFGSKAEARELANLGLGDVRAISKGTGKGKAKNFNEVDELSDLQSPFGKPTVIGTGKGASKGGKGKGTQQTTRPQQPIDDIANIFKQVAKETKATQPRGSIFSPTSVGSAVGIRTGLRSDFGNVLSPPRTRGRDDVGFGFDLGVIPASRSDEGFKLAEDIGAVTPVPQQQRVIQTVIPDEDFLRTPEFFQGEDVIPERGTGLIPFLDTGTPPPPFQPTKTVPEDPTKPPTRLGGGGLPFFNPFGDETRRRRRLSKKRKSNLGGRLFDIADEPFGEVAVGLGFFVETQRGETSIEEALGVGEEEFEPITRQEKQARERLGVGKGRRRQENFAEGFDFDNFF